MSLRTNPPAAPLDFQFHASTTAVPKALRKSEAPAPIRFDPYRRAKSATLKSDIAALVVHLERHEKRQRQRKLDDARHFALAVEALACNLLVNVMVNPSRPLAVPRSNGMMHLASDLKPEVYGSHFLKAIDLMVGLGLISQPQLGHRFHTAKRPGRGIPSGSPRRQLTHLCPGPDLASHLPVGRVCWDDFRHEPWPDVVILKATKGATKAAAIRRAERVGVEDERHDDPPGTRIWFPPSPETDRLTADMRSLNAQLEVADIQIDPAGITSWEHPETGQLIDPTQRQLRRIFNNGCWTEGGRLFHGFWETMPREVRRSALRIQGEAVANVDFSQLFPRLCYALAGARPEMADLYDIEGNGLHRAGWKKMLNALLFHRRDMKQWPEGAREEFGPGWKCSDAVARIKQRHGAIAYLFSTGIGFKLMYTESQILMDALPRLFAAGIVALPLHDSVLVAASKAQAAKAILEDAYCRLTGQDEAFVTVG